MSNIIFFFVSIGIFNSLFSQECTSAWLEKPLVIDGENTEWKNMPRYYNSETLTMYEVFNDNEHLYLTLELASKEIQMKLMRAGFQLNFSTKIKPKVKASIFFSAGLKQPTEHNTNHQKRPYEKMIQDYILKASHAKIVGFNKSTKAIKRNVNGSESFTFNFGCAKNEHMLIELKVPLTELFETPVNINNISNKPLSIQLKIYGLERSMANELLESDINMSTEPRITGMPSMVGGIGYVPEKTSRQGIGQNGPGVNSQEQHTLHSEQSFKIKVTLSKKPDSKSDL